MVNKPEFVECDVNKPKRSKNTHLWATPIQLRKDNAAQLINSLWQFWFKFGKFWSLLECSVGENREKERRFGHSYLFCGLLIFVVWIRPPSFLKIWKKNERCASIGKLLPLYTRILLGLLSLLTYSYVAVTRNSTFQDHELRPFILLERNLWNMIFPTTFIHQACNKKDSRLLGTSGFSKRHRFVARQGNQISGQKNKSKYFILYHSLVMINYQPQPNSVHPLRVIYVPMSKHDSYDAS